MHLPQHLLYHNCEGTGNSFSQVYTSAMLIEVVNSFEAWELAYLTDRIEKILHRFENIIVS
jgi:hypothetical protein